MLLKDGKTGDIDVVVSEMKKIQVVVWIWKVNVATLKSGPVLNDWPETVIVY